MFRKLLLIMTLMFAVPALANATWYISTSTSGTGTITNGGLGLKGYPDTTNSVDLAVAPGTGQKISSVRVNGVALAAVADPTVGNTYTIAKKTGTQYVVAYFTATKYTVTPTVIGGGSIAPAFTGTANNALVSGTSYTYNIKPNTGYKLVALKDNGLDQALAATYTFTAISANHTLEATFAINPTGSASVSASGSMTKGQPVTLSGQATANEPITGYSFTVNGTPVAAGTDPKVASYVPATSGVYAAEFTATTASTSYKKSITFKVDGSIAIYNNCVSCHAGRTAAVVSDFTNSKHWKNSFEYGSEFTGGEVADQINPNESWTTKENGTLVTCSAKCHFKSQTNASACNTCHATGQFSGTTLIDGATVGMAAPAATAANTCFVCHSGSKHGATTNNFKKSTHYTGPHAKLYYQMDQKACVACHNSHSTEASYEGCNSCHRPGSPYSIYSSNMVGKAPHFQTGVATFGRATSAMNGLYAKASYIQPTAAVSSTCADCHGHDNTINAGWAEGGHGNVSAVPWKSDAGHVWFEQGPAIVLPANATAQQKLDEKHLPTALNGVNFQVSPQQTNCIRCHTSKGFAAFVDSGFTKIDKIRTAAGLPISDSAPLTCNGCHLNPDNRAAAGWAGQGLRLANFTTASHGTKGYVALWGYSTATIAKKKIVTAIQLGDNRNSNICMPCHSQRASGQEIKDLFAAPAFKQYSAGSAIYPHAAQPAAVFYGKGGYEFTSAQGYQDRARHQRIGNYVAGGATGYNNTGITQGACVGCHYTADAKYGIGGHALEAVKFETFSSLLGRNTPAQIISNECLKCHPAEFTVANLEEKKAEFNAAVKALGALLVKKGITQDGVNPLAERKAFDMSVGAKNNAIAEKNMGAWFNWYLFSTADKGAYAHNPSYARRLIFDSIDWLDDGVMNSSSTNTILALSGAAQGNKLTSVEANAATSFTNDPGCLGCHFGNGAVANAVTVPGIEQAPHYNATPKAQFVAANLQCNNCHGIGHGSDSPRYSFSTAAFPMLSSATNHLLKDFAEQGHADVNSAVFGADGGHDFKNSADCNACHTTTGFVRALANGFTNTAAWGTTADATKEIIACNACHSSTTWSTSVRTIAGGYTAGMGGYGAAAKANITFSDVGESNVCIPCHAGRENGDSINAITDFTNASFKNPHYLGAAAVFYGKGGFKFYGAGNYKEYNGEGRNATWSHGKLGMDNFSTATSAAYPGRVVGSGNKGQCVACHLGATNTHTFSAEEVAAATVGTSATVGGCYGCHVGESIPALLEEEKTIFNAGMDFFNWQLADKGLYYSDAYPYFFNNTAKTAALKNWTVVGPTGGTAAQNMGAAQNFKLLAAEKGSYVHNRSFARQMIYDSIQYLQYGSVDKTDVAKKVSFAAYSTANPGLTTKIGPYTPYGSTSVYYGATAIQKWMTNSSGFRK